MKQDTSHALHVVTTPRSTVGWVVSRPLCGPCNMEHSGGGHMAPPASRPAGPGEAATCPKSAASPGSNLSAPAQAGHMTSTLDPNRENLLPIKYTPANCREVGDTKAGHEPMDVR